MIGLAAIGCTKETNGGLPGPKNGPSENFDWKTTKDIPVDIVSKSGGNDPVFIYNGEEIVAAGYTPFKEIITVPKSCTELLVAAGPMPLAYSSKADDGIEVVTLRTSASRSIEINTQTDWHDYLYKQWTQWEAGKHPWNSFVTWWNQAGGAMGHSSITLFVNKKPEYVNGTLSYIPHKCHTGGCQWSDDQTEEDDSPVLFKTYGTYIFEDLFPWMGDYDMNDFVVTESATKKILGNNNIKEVSLTYTIKAAGSSKVMAMAVQLLGVQASDVKEITMSRVDENGATVLFTCTNTRGMFNMAANGLEVTASGNDVVIPIFENFFDLIPQSAKGYGFNTVKASNGGKGDPLVFNIDIRFKTGVSVSMSDFKTDVFIMPGSADQSPAEHRGTEIHVADARYTSLMNTALFGTGDDASKAPEKCFRAKNGYVWAIYFPFEYFNHALEGKDYSLDKSYPRFVNWIETEGEVIKYQNWYKYPETGMTWEY